jgi:UDP-arabinose 4-epimerase
MRVLVTGGAGYIGSHTAKALAGTGWEPVVLDDLSKGHEWAVQWGPFVHGNVGDRDLLRQVLREHRIEGVVHFAASAHVGESVSAPRQYFQNNVTNTLVLLDAMLDAGVERIVFSSTCATYGVPRALPIGEDHPQQPVNPYGESKLFVERVLHAYGHAYGLRWMALRYFNAAGADPDGDLGEDPDQATRLIPLAIAAARGHRAAIDIFGTDYPTPDGTAIRDYVHVTDLSAAHVLALRSLSNEGESVALNLGTGQGHSVREVIATVERVTGHSVPVREAPRRPGDLPEFVADARRAHVVLGWQPRYADLGVIVQTAWDWYVTVRAGMSGFPPQQSTSAAAKR